MTGFLASACDAARLRVREAARLQPPEELRAQAAAAPAPPSFASALAAAGLSVVAEVKRASPSRGALAEIPDPAGLGLAYEAGGAAAVSVLTEPTWFRGSLDDLRAVAAAVTVPVLRKDFLIDPYQVAEARVAGAAAVLLIVAALGDDDLVALLREADAVGLDALVEVHDADDAARAATALTRAATGRRAVVGVNARDLDSLSVSGSRFAQLRAALRGPGLDEALAVAESGVRGPDDAAAVAGSYDAVLVGEAVATADDPTAAVRALVAAGAVSTAEVNA